MKTKVGNTPSSTVRDRLCGVPGHWPRVRSDGSSRTGRHPDAETRTSRDGRARTAVPARDARSILPVYSLVGPCIPEGRSKGRPASVTSTEVLRGNRLWRERT